jgi:thiamine biosynthesis lipoprotein
MMLRRNFIRTSLGTFAGIAGACLPGGMWRSASGSGAHLYRGAALAFGTTISVSVVHDDQRQAELAIEDAFQAARMVDRLMSIYSPDSQVFQLNRDGALTRPDPHLLLVLEQARQLSQMSGGAFDVTVQPLWRVFSDAQADAGLPTQRQRQDAQARIGWRALAFDRKQVRFLRPGMALTLNGLAQGYAADLALAAVRARGVAHALLDTGEFIAQGRSARQQPWMLGIRDPRDAGALAASVYINGRSVATSGDYESAFSADLMHHHIFDPALGDSSPELASVTVLAPSALLADGLSTAFMAMGLRKARALAAGMPAVDLMTIDKKGRVWKSPGFAASA